MSDPESSVAASSSPSLSATDSNVLNYAFLVHSQKTLTQNLPPRVDNKLLARQKRRRTSPEDHAVLEAEYQKNPKPDKVARASIVSRVSLGEKEVQIWFQNRRQNDRRKSKPLQPHELLALRSSMTDSSAQPASDDSASAEPSSSGAEPSSDTQDLHGPRTSKPWDGEILQFSDRSDPVSEDKEGEPGLPSQSSQSTVATDALEDTQTTIHEDLEQPDQDMGDGSSPHPPKRKRSASDIRGEGGNEQSSTEKSPPSLRLSMSFDGEAMVRKEGELTPSPPKSRNALRIAMSCDGKAVIRAEDEPSPPKTASSAIFPTSTEKDRVFGRSRDPRNWESFFDTDARSALSTPTSSQPGPNAASPGLFHSRSQRSLSRSLSGRHSLLARAEATTTPISQSIGEKRRKLSRTVSSLGRLENSRNRGMGFAPKTPFKPMSSKLSSKPDLQLDDDDDDGDSDKENWIPGTRTSNMRRKTTSHPSRPVLKETNRNRGLGIMTNGKRNRPFPNGLQNKAPPELSADVSAFMSGAGGASQEDDLDCVQGLLSLSQGAWR
ncbi:hypothetical protein N7510_011258 [Penicillium lagena]|uniref:uncharacterized protein n=1 Tax=Penicillium lagena TaxID=94218 RepID=UPI0025403FBA|nr:uncharacterized protein N7510_011258 [Penicillium lagena]KAJ5601724.1 hypothetical protein N7510_011258 [Penicillium lagena]